MRDHKDATDLVVKPIVIDRAAFNQGQNAQYEPHIEETEVMDSLVARGPHAVGQPIPIQDGREMEKNQNGMGIAKEGDHAYTIDTTGAQAVGQPIAIQGTIIGRSENAGPQGIGATEGGPMFTLTKTDIHGVAIPYRKSKRACSTTDNETWVEADASNTLNNFDLGDTRTTHAVVEPFAWTQNQREEVRILGDKTGALALPGTHQSNYIAEPQVYENHPNDSRITGPLDVAPTVVSRFGTGGGNVPLVSQEPHIVQASELRLRGQITEQETVPTLLANTKSGDNDPLAVHPVAFQPGNLRRQGGADPSTEVFPTLTKDSGDQSPHVAHPVVPLDGMNLLSRLGPCSDEHSIQNFTPGDPSFTLKKGGNQHGVFTPMAVRRLTPVECERLQGFPDNWSRISWKGKPEDQCPDGPRYKACGNSMAVPVMRWIGERIAQADAKHFPPTP
jgi:site-specific DNA-cytosine methylase